MIAPHLEDSSPKDGSSYDIERFFDSLIGRIVFETTNVLEGPTDPAATFVTLG